MNLLIDMTELTTFNGKLIEARDTILDNIDAIYQGVDSMNAGWEGPSYEEFRQKILSYKVYLDSIAGVYRAFEWINLHYLSQDIMTLTQSLDEAYQMLGGE
jgi:uncharacterized protein YukE